MYRINYSSSAPIYAKHSLGGTGYLAFKYVPGIIERYANGKKTLDYGCGSGRSTRFLRDLGLAVEGVDISDDMIAEAIERNQITQYTHIQSASLPYANQTFDIVFSCLVLFEIPTKKEILDVFLEISRVLKNDGVFIAVTGSTEMYSHQWLSLDANYPENYKLKSGSLAKILLKEVDLTLLDYYWTDDDYKEIINESGLNLVEQFYPLGDSKDGIGWLTETKVSPYVTYILKKQNNFIIGTTNKK